jgi:hypothetical protein
VDALIVPGLENKADLFAGRITQSLLSRIHNTPTPQGWMLCNARLQITADAECSRRSSSQAVGSCDRTTNLNGPAACQSGVEASFLQVQWYLAKRHTKPRSFAIIHALLNLTLNDEQISNLQIRTWLETKELITIQQIGGLLNGLSEHINSICNQS